MPKQRSTRGPVRFIAVAALTLFVVAGCSGSSQYSEELRTNFLRACLDNGGTATSCDCSLEYIEGEKTEADYVRIELEMLYEGIVDDVVYDALIECGIADEASGGWGSTTVPPDAVGSLLSSWDRADDATIRDISQEVSQAIDTALSVPEILSQVKSCEITPTLFVATILGMHDFEGSDMTYEDWILFGLASADVYNGETWAEFVAKCG